MNTSTYVDTDAGFGSESRYHKKRVLKKKKNLYSSLAEDGANAEDEEDGIIVTEDDIISPHKTTAQIITMVGTDGSSKPKPPPVSKCNLLETMVIRPLYRRTMTFQSFHLPTKPRMDLSHSAKLEMRKSHTKEMRRNKNVLRKLPLYRMKNDLKRKLHKLERKLSRIKRDELVKKLSARPPSPQVVKTPTHISGLISQIRNPTSKSKSGSRSASTNRRQYSSRELIQKISESSQDLQKLELELSLRREHSKSRTASSKGSPKSVYEQSPLRQEEEEEIVEPQQAADDEGGKPPPKGPKKRVAVGSRRKKPEVVIKKKKRKRIRKPKKQKANLRGFKQEVPIEGIDYKMEIFLEPELIARTRTGNIDFHKDPNFVVKTTKASDLRDEFASYCGQRKFIKNWLFQV